MDLFERWLSALGRHIDVGLDTARESIDGAWDKASDRFEGSSTTDALRNHARVFVLTMVFVVGLIALTLRGCTTKSQVQERSDADQKLVDRLTRKAGGGNAP